MTIQERIRHLKLTWAQTSDEQFETVLMQMIAELKSQLKEQNNENNKTESVLGK